MGILKEFINPNTVNLTNTQQGVLITIKIAPTPEVAYQSTSGAQQLVYARNTLRMLGLIKVGDNKTVLTNNGTQVLLNYNLVDETGQMTQRGQQIMDNYNKQFNRSEDQEQANMTQNQGEDQDVGLADMGDENQS